MALFRMLYMRAVQYANFNELRILLYYSFIKLKFLEKKIVRKCLNYDIRFLMCILDFNEFLSTKFCIFDFLWLVLKTIYYSFRFRCVILKPSEMHK